MKVYSEIKGDGEDLSYRCFDLIPWRCSLDIQNILDTEGQFMRDKIDLLAQNSYRAYYEVNFLLATFPEATLLWCHIICLEIHVFEHSVRTEF